MPRVPTYSEHFQQPGPSPLPAIRIPGNIVPNNAGAFEQVNRSVNEFRRDLQEKQAALNRAEAISLTGKTVAELDSIVQQNAQTITDPEEFLQQTTEALDSHRQSVLDGIENSEIRNELSRRLEPHIAKGKATASALQFGKARDAAKATVENALPAYSDLGINMETEEERQGARSMFGGIVYGLRSQNLLSAEAAAQYQQNFDERTRIGRRNLFVSGLSGKLQGIVNDATTGKSVAEDAFKQGNQAIDGFTDMLPAEREKYKLEFRDSLWTGAVDGMIRRDPVGTLKQLREGQFNAKVDPQSLKSLTDKAESEIEKLQRRAEAERKEHVRQIGKLVDDFKDARMAGFDWAGNEAQLAAAVKGTEHEAAFENVRAASKILGQFNQMAPVEQEQYLRIVSNGPKSGDGAKFYSTLQAAHEKTKTALAHDPLTFAIKQRVIPPLNQFNLNNPDSLKERSIAAGIVSQRYGIAASPLSDDEATNLSQTLGKATADQQVQTLRQLRRGLEDSQVKSVAAQLAKKKDDPVLVQAMALSLEGKEAEEASSRILRGREILRDNKEIGLKGADLKTAQDKIASTLGEAYNKNPAHYSAVADAALNIYAFKSWQSKDLSGVIDTTRLEESIKEASGGVIQLGRFGSRYTVQAPRYGRNEADFMELLKRADYSKAKGITAADIEKHGIFESIGDGRYLVKVGPGYVQGDRGPFILDLNLPPPRARSGATGATLGAVGGMVR